MPQPIVIFDTNALRNPSLKKYLGCNIKDKKDENVSLLEIAKIAKIVIPKIVLEEIEKQKKEQFDKQKEDYKKLKKEFVDHFHESFELTVDSDIESQEFDWLLRHLKKQTDIIYEVIDIDNSYFDKIRFLAINKLPPFAGDDKKSDKGFKDAIFHFSVLNYFEVNPTVNLILIRTDDILLKKSFEKYPKVVIVKTYEEINKYNIESVLDEYFKSKFDDHILNNDFPLYIKMEDIEMYMSQNNNTILHYQIEDNHYYFEIDSGEIISSDTIEYDISQIASNLILSGNFKITHEYIYQLKNYLHLLSGVDLDNIIKALTDNQVNGTVGYGETDEFYKNIFELPDLTQNQKELIKKYFKSFIPLPLKISD